MLQENNILKEFVFEFMLFSISLNLINILLGSEILLLQNYLL